MSGRVGSRSKSPKPPPPPPPPSPPPPPPSPRLPKGRRLVPPRRLKHIGDPNVPEAFDTQPIKTLVIITCHSNACECVTGECFRPRFKTPYDLLFTSNYGCPTIIYGSFFHVARNLFGNISSSIVRRDDRVNGDVITRAIYSTVSVQNLGKDSTGDWLGLPGTLGRSTNLKFHEKGKKASNLTMFAPGISEAQDVNGVYVFQLAGADSIPRFRDDNEIRGYNILNKPEVLAQLKIQKNPDTSTKVQSGLFHYHNSTYYRKDRGDITLKYLLDGLKKLETVDVRGRSTLMVPPEGALVIPLTCRILEGAPREGEPLESPTSSQFIGTSSTPPDNIDELFGPGGGGGGGGGVKTRRHRHIRHKLTKKYRLRSRSRSRSRTKSKSTRK
jgi:hypothetical protein